MRATPPFFGRHVGLVLIVIATSTCTSTNATVTRGQGIAIRAADARSPGTRLGDGLRVPRGASLAGAALPNAAVQLIFRGTPVRAPSWTATLAVGGSPSSVADALLAQARRAHFPNLPSRVECFPNGSSPPEGSLTQTTVPPGRAGSARTSAPSTCRFGTAPRRFDHGPTGRELRVEITRIAGIGTWGVVEFARYPGRDAPPRPNEPLRFPPLDVRPNPRPPTKLPMKGDPIGRSDGPGFVVVDGSAAILPTLPVDGSNWTALLAVTGDRRRVFNAYVARLRQNLRVGSGPSRSDNGTPRFTIRNERRGPWRVRVAFGNDGAPDGGAESVELLTLGGRSFIRIHATNG